MFAETADSLGIAPNLGNNIADLPTAKAFLDGPTPGVESRLSGPPESAWAGG